MKSVFFTFFIKRLARYTSCEPFLIVFWAILLKKI